MSNNSLGKRNNGVLPAVLKAFIPYSPDNLMLAHHPNQFFNHLEYLEKIAANTGASRETVRTTISRAKKNGLLRIKDGKPYVTWRGKIKARVIPKAKLRHFLVIIFDIPERNRKQRDLFRAYLRGTYCEQVQKSVWKTKFDILEELQEAISDLGIERYVTIFLADEING